jgi:hypothetical protein
MRVLSIAMALAACGGAQAPAREPRITGSVVGSPARFAASCDSVRAKVEGLYRADAQAHEPTRIAEATADNTAMAMNDCTKAPEASVACIGRITTVAELEQQCLAALDAEGTEGEAAR